MERSYNRYSFLYINGELSPEKVHFLESQDDFMKRIIRLTKNKEYYFRSSDRVKKDGDFALELIDIFKDDHEFLFCMGETYESLNDYNSANTMEVDISLSNLYEETNDEILFDFYSRAESFYKSIMDDVLHEIMTTKEFGERKELGQGFILTDMTFHFSPIIKEFIAKKMTESMLLDHPMYEFEELIHYTGINLTALHNREREFIFRYITKEDKALGDYLAIHPRLTDKYIPMIKDAEENWDNYLKVTNLDKIDQVKEEMDIFIKDNNIDEDSKELYRGIVDLTKAKNTIYKYSDFKNEKYRKVDLSTISLPELRLVKHMVEYIDEVFDLDVPFVDMENVPEYSEDPENKDSKVISMIKYKKKK